MGVETHNLEAQGLATALGQFSKIVEIEDPSGRNRTRDVVINKLRAKQFVAVFQAVDELVEAGVVRLADANGALIVSDKGFLEQFKYEKLILRGGEPVLKILSIVSGLTKDEVDNLDLLDLIKLLSAAWEVNQRFFDQNQAEIKAALGPVWTLIETLAGSMKRTPSESSPDSSMSSSATATEASPK
jgi:hypothetical protein